MDEQDEFPVEIADRIVRMLHQVTEQNVNFMGKGGVILATMQPERLGQIHEGARRIMSGEVDELAITPEDAKGLQGTLPGYNGVILYKGSRLGCIGLTGDPQQMRPLQQLATIIVREELEKYRTEVRKREILKNVLAQIDEITSAVRQISAGSENVFQHSRTIEQMTDHAEKSIRNVNGVVKTVKRISEETMLLGFNASIEAARAGDYGKGFGVVAQEIGRFSTDSDQSLKDINGILNEIKSSISDIAEKVRKNTAITQEQAEAIRNVNQSLTEIQTEAGRLTEMDS